MISHLASKQQPLYQMPPTSGHAAEIVMRDILVDVPPNQIIAALATYRNGLLNELIEEFKCSTTSSGADISKPHTLQ